MELKVWVEGIQRIVCGVTDVTTCQDVVYALAHATGKTGRFTLMERWRNSERLLAPQEHPLKILLKWGEYASDVQFILQRTALEPKGELRQEAKIPHGVSFSPHQRPGPPPIPGGPQRVGHKGGDPPTRGPPQSPPQNRDIKKSLTFSGGHSSHLEGVGPLPHPSEVGALPQGFLAKASPLQYSHPPALDTPGGPIRHHYPPNASSRPVFSTHRPPAPPPYELVRGHPPPPPSGGPRPPFHSFGPPHGPKDRRKPAHPPMRSPPPYPPSFRGPSPPCCGRPLRELPPYRDPPPPPPPSHPALMKMSPSRGGGPPHPTSFPQSPEGVQLPPQGPDHDKKFSGGVESLEGPTSRDKPKGTPQCDEARPLPSPGGQKSSRASEKSKKEEHWRLRERDDPNLSGSPVNVSFEHSKSPGRVEDHRAGSPTKTPPNNQASTAPRTLLDNSFNGEDAPDDDGDAGDINDNLISSVISSQSNKSSVAHNKSLRETLKRTSSPGEPPPSGEEGEKGMVQSIIKQLVKSSARETGSVNNHYYHTTEEVVVDGYYREMVKLVNQQREKISAQQVDLTKFEAEIAFTEGRWKEEESRLAYLQEEIQRLERTPEKQQPPVDTKLLAQLEEQLKAAKKAESSSQEEIADIQKKIAACDHQLAQLNARIRSIQEALHQEEAAQRQKQEAAQQEEEEQEALLREVEKLQVAVGQATEQASHMQGLSQQLAQEMSEAEARLEEKRREVDALKQAMREANLEALSMTPAEEAKAHSENKTGSAKTGSNRRMVGSPRQLETAVPTSKNPHGVWV